MTRSFGALTVIMAVPKQAARRIGTAWRWLRADPFDGAAGRLPRRVQDIIVAHEAGSERLIGWAQLFVGATWLALYAAAPKTFAADQTFAPVPVALGLYLGFTALRLLLVQRGFLPSWLLTLSVLFDMSLLLGLIWSFHLQYQQPAAFYLKAPTVLYVFIFIALRALRFSARYVVLTGALAALGWFALLYYAIATSEAPNMGVTRNYVEYMTSSTILLGAEVDKIIAILLTTTILALAIVRARSLLVASIVESVAHRDLARFFSPAVEAQITQAEDRIQAGQGKLRDATIVFADIRGFTKLTAELAPDELMATLAEYQRRMLAVVLRHGGIIDKFMGDGIMATFGAVVPSETHAADALRAIEGMIEASAAWAEERRRARQRPLQIGFSAASGRVVFGAVGDAERLEYTVIGDAVNTAAKVEKHTKAERVAALALAETWTLAIAQGYRPRRPFVDCGPRQVDGLPAPVSMIGLT